MAISTAVLGMNARNFLYIRKYNRRSQKQIADDKLATKERLIQNGVPTTGLIAKFDSLDDVRSFDWSSLPKDFVVKPSHGYAGQGIRIVKKWDGEKGKTTKGTVITKHDIETEIFGALDGEFSLKNLRDTAFIEDRVKIHSFFKKVSAGGVPDIRVIVCNKIPVMAMLRMPTQYSDGKANLHMGAVGIGIDMRTGITTFGVVNGRLVKTIPGKKTKIRGMKIPYWEEVLTIASQAQISSKLGFVGVDIILDEERGPLVLEINARPGLSIQIANQDSLRTRLERVEHLEVKSVARAVELAQTLFANAALEEVGTDTKVLGVIEKVTIYGKDKRKTVQAKIDTGAYRTSIDSALVHELGLDEHDHVVHVRAGSGRQKRKTTRFTFRMKGKEKTTVATYTERGHMRFPMIIGRRDMKGFVVDPGKIPEGVKVR